ncbi:hypothetical protein AB0I53_14055 [Saccharopolyspora sp. NPDC050389]|uniref:hypothetical protein n=1 Tax=Saccharopolyspora sp. NPDC050389 TaxID=3155516 RepID=UPI0033F4A848
MKGSDHPVGRRSTPRNQGMSSQIVTIGLCCEAAIVHLARSAAIMICPLWRSIIRDGRKNDFEKMIEALIRNDRVDVGNCDQFSINSRSIRAGMFSGIAEKGRKDAARGG